jgi:hypothetical protein
MFVTQSVKRVKTVRYAVEKPLFDIKDSHPIRTWTFEPDEFSPSAHTLPVKAVAFSFSAVDGRWQLRDYLVECDTGQGPGTHAVAMSGLDEEMPGWLAELAVDAAQER